MQYNLPDDPKTTTTRVCKVGDIVSVRIAFSLQVKFQKKYSMTQLYGVSLAIGDHTVCVTC